VPARQREDSGTPPGWSLQVVANTDGEALVTASGEFDVAAVPDVHRTIRQAASTVQPPALVIIDLSDVTFLDAAMLGALVTERTALRDAGTDLVVVGVTPWAMRIIDICGLRATLGL
jgi:anti-sigma B factor antagonist